MRGPTAVATVLGLILGLLPWEFIALLLSMCAFVFGLVALYLSAHAMRGVAQIQEQQAERIDGLIERRRGRGV